MLNRDGLSLTIATRVPIQGNSILTSYGYKPAKDQKELAGKLISFQNKHREDALRSIAAIHPDKDLIIHFHEEEKAKIKGLSVGNGTEKAKSNACGCGVDGKKCGADGGKCKCKSSSAEGATTTNIFSKVIAGHTVKEWMPLALSVTLVIASAIVFSVEHNKSSKPTKE